ncbi:MAG: nuclear transport factor 2 family protein [Chloroflexi bacterium]|nr:nuclear transport factor 2 family protein [Chloroflexota bacterium]
MAFSGDELDARHRVCEAYLAFLGRRDYDGMASCLADDVLFRAMTPGSFCDASGPAETVAVLQDWWDDVDVFDMQRSGVDSVGDRMRISYTLRIHDEEGWAVVEQQSYCDVSDRAIHAIDLLCSGFRPIDPPA